MRSVAVLFTLVALAGPAAAGELLLANGSRIDGELANEVLVVSTGADLIEVTPESVGVLTPAEIYLRDGRVLHGKLVGGRLKARTSLGELAIQVEELRSYRADAAPATPAAPAAAAMAPVPATPAPAAVAPAQPEVAAPRDAGLPPVTLYQPDPPAQQVRVTPVATNPSPRAGTSAPGGPVDATGERPAPGARLEVVSPNGTLHREALAAAASVGRVERGEQVTYIDSIDRRLRIFNALIFDGGYWIKVRAGNGTEGWLPAASVREVR
jgi:hypothetical protein